jgi:hypothetical protein
MKMGLTLVRDGSNWIWCPGAFPRPAPIAEESLSME